MMTKKEVIKNIKFLVKTISMSWRRGDLQRIDFSSNTTERTFQLHPLMYK
jgi:hypothetical protein